MLEYQAIEFLNGASGYWLSDRLGLERGSVFDFLDRKNAINLLEQRQRIYFFHKFVENILEERARQDN